MIEINDKARLIAEAGAEGLGMLIDEYIERLIFDAACPERPDHCGDYLDDGKCARWDKPCVFNSPGNCTQCNSETGLKYPNGSEPYCEDCGWPDSDFDKEGEAMKVKTK